MTAQILSAASISNFPPLTFSKSSLISMLHLPYIHGPRAEPLQIHRYIHKPQFFKPRGYNLSSFHKQGKFLRTDFNTRHPVMAADTELGKSHFKKKLLRHFYTAQLFPVIGSP